MKRRKYINRKMYVHYGSNKFDPNKITPEAPWCNKPKGLWASPRNTKFSWADFVRYDWDTKIYTLKSHFTFTLKKNARILVIKNHYDIIPYLKEENNNNNFFKNKKKKDELTINDFYIFSDIRYQWKIDWEKIYNNYDGMEVYAGENWCEFHESYLFNTYDCDSIVIWNTSIIERVC